MMGSREKEQSELETLEKRLQEDSLPDPGDAFFTELHERVMQEVAQREVPRRRFWDRFVEALSWATRPIPAAALAAATVLLVLGLVWLLRERPTPQHRGVIRQAARRAIVTRSGQPPPTPGEQWLRQLPAADSVAEVDHSSLGQLYRLLQQEVVDEGDDGDDLAGPEPGLEQRLERLEPDELRALYQTLRSGLPQQPRPSGQGPMRRSG